MSTTITVTIPTRIDFAGGWSDVHYFSAREGGAVLNAAILPGVEGTAQWDGQELRLAYRLALPPGSHLGSSASIDVAWLALSEGLSRKRRSPVELAEMAYRVEKVLGVEGGKQDQYAAALGGFNLLRFAREDEPVQIERLEVPLELRHLLLDRCVLCDAGTPEAAGSIHDQVWERYRQGDEGIARALRTIRDSVASARDALLAGDLDALARLLTVNRDAARLLHPDVVTGRMDALFRVGEAAGALGAKACGEGGGGCLLFVCAAGRKDDVQAALRDAGGDIVPFRFVPESRTRENGAC